MKITKTKKDILKKIEVLNEKQKANAHLRRTTSKKIMDFLRENREKEFTAKELSNQLNVEVSAIRSNLVKMKDNRKVDFVKDVAPRGGIYFIYSWKDLRRKN